VKSPEPPASVWITLTTQVLRLLFSIGSGGAKRQLASSAQAPAPPPQLASAVQAMPVFVLPMQCLSGPAPSVQSAGPLPALTTRGTVEPDPATPKMEVEPSTTRDGGTEVAPTPPM
jgi:hypothetical protein